MFVFNRSAAAVILPLVLLLAVVLWSGRSATPDAGAARAESAAVATTVAQADQPHVQGG